MIASFGSNFHRIIPGRHPRRDCPPEDDILLLCCPYVPSIQEARSLLAGIETRSRAICHLDETIADVAARLQRLQARREHICVKNDLARALLVSGLIAGETVEDDVTVLATSYRPDQQEVDRLKSRLDARRQHISLMKKVMRMGMVNDEERKHLRDRIVILKRTCAVGQDILAPIRKLPAEVLAVILTLAVPSLYLHPLIYDHTSQAGREPLHPEEPHPHDVRNCISNVCRKWRKIVEDTPRMWRTLALDFQLPLDISLVAQWLKNSKACHLELFLRISRWFRPEHEGLIPHVLGLIRDECKRIRVFVSQGDIHDHISYLYPFEMHTCALSMEFCSVEQFDPDQQEILLGSINAPRVRTLILLGAHKSLLSLTSTSFSQLRRLIIGAPQMEAPWALWLKILSSCPLLEVLNLTWRDLEPSGQWTMTSLPSLNELVLRTEDSDTIPQILNSLHIPALTVLEIFSCIGCPFIPNVFDSVSEGVAASLCHLKLSFVAFVGEGVAKILQSLTNLRSLHIIDSDVDDILFTSLIPPRFSAPDSWTCPKLLELDLTRSNVFGDELLHLIDARTLPDFVDPHPNFLTSVKVLSCGGLEHHHVARLWQLEWTHASTLHFATDFDISLPRGESR